MTFIRYSHCCAGDLWYKAAQSIILKGEMHLENAEKVLLQDERVQRVIEQELSGTKKPWKQGDFEHTEILGLVRKTSSGYKIATQMYTEIIPRILTNGYFQTEKLNPALYFDSNKRIKITSVLQDFNRFYKENIDSWTNYTIYKESAIPLLLFGYLAKIIDSSGRIQYIPGDNSILLSIDLPLDGSWVFPKQREVIQIKLA